MVIKIVGTHCPRCNTLERLVRRAIGELGLEAQLEFVDDPREIVRYTFQTPALVINEKVVVKGRVPTYPQVLSLLTTYAVDS